MTVPSPGANCLLIVADYPYVQVGREVFSEIPWDESFAQPYLKAFQKILLLGRFRRAGAAPPGWIRVDPRFFEVLEAGDWTGPAGFLRNLPALFRVWRANRQRVRVLYLKLFYLTSLAIWTFNRSQSRARRRPVATLLVGDSQAAVGLREDLFPSSLVRRVSARIVGGLVRYIQRRADLPGYVARFLAAKFSRSGTPLVIANESWLQQSNIVSHDRRGARKPATILFVGRMIRLKRIDHLLEAVRRLVAEHHDLRVVVAGDGPVREELQQLVLSLGLAARVTFTGWVQPRSPALFRLYDQADIFCLPSYSEGLPLVVLEAMGRGVPVVATAVSGTPEAVEHERSGLLVPRDDLAALTNALRRLLDDPGLWRRCVDGGYEVARRNTFETQRGILAAGISGLAR